MSWGCMSARVLEMDSRLIYAVTKNDPVDVVRCGSGVLILAKSTQPPFQGHVKVPLGLSGPTWGPFNGGNLEAGDHLVDHAGHKSQHLHLGLDFVWG